MKKVERRGRERGMDRRSVRGCREGRERKPAVLNPEETTGRMRNQWKDR